jgi:hypothetical protein
MIGNDAGELLPCPFCGGEAHPGSTTYSRPLDDVWWADGSAVTKTYRINCVSCGGTAGGGLVGGQQTPEKAITAWNTRTTPASAGVLVEALEAQMEAQDENLPSSIARERGLVWLEGWFDFNSALSTTATPASATKPSADNVPATGNVFRDHPRVGFKGLSTPTPTPDRFGEGYRAGVEASAKVAEHGFVTGPTDQMWEYGSKYTRQQMATAIRALRPAAGGEA